MDSSLWCTTPQTVMEMVFARLPLPQMFQLRALSKHWRASIMSSSFQHAFGTTRSRRFATVSNARFAFESDEQFGLWSFGTKDKKGYTLLFDFLPRGCNKPVARDGGLLCCQHQYPSKHPKDLYVCNPLTQAWRKLALPSQVERFDLVHLVTDLKTKQYTIMVLSDDLEQNEHHKYGSAKVVVEVYDSARKMWSASGGAFQLGGNNLFYYKKYMEENFVEIRAYDTTTGYSTTIPIDSIPFDIIALQDIFYSEVTGFFSLAEHQGQIYLLSKEAATSGV